MPDPPRSRSGRRHLEPVLEGRRQRRGPQRGPAAGAQPRPDPAARLLDVKPSRVYKTPRTSLCGDFDGDGDADRAVHYQCCTVSSPAPWVVLRRQGSRWPIAYRRLHDTTFKLYGSGTSLMTTEPKYSRSDPNCCPSRLRIGRLRWTGAAFKRSFELRAAPRPS